ncbi:MAG: hypothetical protein HKL80_05550 [Acidimicrobiales bacterium]|nr:hypothetical protein [Acidimicrobiales bacterium]
MTVSLSRRMWVLLESIHALTYFAPEASEIYSTVGLRGFWRGYFAGRSAPLGNPGAKLVTATFYNFAPSMVERAIPEVWEYASPEEAIEARTDGASRALERIIGGSIDLESIQRAAKLLWKGLDGIDVSGRPLGGANLELNRPQDPLDLIWLGATVYREFRGDGHVATLLNAGIDGCQAHVTFAATGNVVRSVLQPVRGWSDNQWEKAEDDLKSRGLLDQSGRRTEKLVGLREQIEDNTDELSMQPWEELGNRGSEELMRLLIPISRTIVESKTIPSVNPIGLPPA